MVKMIRSKDEAVKAEKVVSMLAYKIKNGTATPEEIERHRAGLDHLLIYDWGTESYQNYVPNQIAAAAARKEARQQKSASIVARRTVPDSQPSVVPDPVRPPLRRRAGKFAV